jgi:hypothetical protein
MVSFNRATSTDDLIELVFKIESLSTEKEFGVDWTDVCPLATLAWKSLGVVADLFVVFAS